MKLLVLLAISLFLKLGFHLALSQDTFVSHQMVHDNKEKGLSYSVGGTRYLKSSKSDSISKDSKSKSMELKRNKSYDWSEKYVKSSKGKGKSVKWDSEKYDKSKGKSGWKSKSKGGKSSKDKYGKSKGKGSKSDSERPTKKNKRNRIREGVKTERGEGKRNKKCKRVKL